MKSLYQINVGEIALHKDVKVNSIETRFSAIKSRHKINVGTTTDGFPKPKNASTTPKKIKATATATDFSQLMMALEGSPVAQGQGRGAAARPKRTPKPTARKRQADDQDSWYDEDGGSSSPSKRHMSDVDVDDEGKEDSEAAAWHAVDAQGHYDGYYVLDGAKYHGY